MATPHVAGSAALAIQAHPQWSAEEVSAALVNTADSAQLVGYSPQLGGNGLVQPFAATQTSVIARADDGTPSVSLGVAELTRDFTGGGRITLENHGRSPASFAVSVQEGTGSPHTATTDSASITVAGHQSATLHVNVAVPVATVGDSSAFRQVQGQIALTPTSGNNGVALSVPYYLVARARSIVQARLRGSGTVTLTNSSASVAGTADFYAWGLRGDHTSLGSIGLRAVGVQSFTDPIDGQILVFAMNTFARSSNPVTTIYDLFLDVNGDGIPDYDVEAADLGLLTGTGGFNGEMVVAVFNLSTGSGVLEFLATAPTDGTTVLLPLVAADVGISSANPRFSYTAQTTDLTTGSVDTIPTAAGFNAFNNAISTGAFVPLVPGASASVPMAVNRKEFALTPALGAMVVSLENTTNQNEQALLLRLGDD
jgi:hypothetical protein